MVSISPGNFPHTHIMLCLPSLRSFTCHMLWLQLAAERLQKSELAQVLSKWSIISKALHAWRQFKANVLFVFKHTMLCRAFVRYETKICINTLLDILELQTAQSCSVNSTCATLAVIRAARQCLSLACWKHAS